MSFMDREEQRKEKERLEREKAGNTAAPNLLGKGSGSVFAQQAQTGGQQYQARQAAMQADKSQNIAQANAQKLAAQQAAAQKVQAAKDNRAQWEKVRALPTDQRIAESNKLKQQAVVNQAATAPSPSKNAITATLPDRATQYTNPAAKPVATNVMSRPMIGNPQTPNVQPPMAPVSQASQSTNATPNAVPNAAPNAAMTDADAPVFNEGVTRGDSGKGFGLSVDNNAPVAQAAAPSIANQNMGMMGFNVPRAPTKAYGEDSRRAALAMDIRPYEKMNGRLTTSQIALKNAILSGDDAKYASENYKAGLGAAQAVAQTGMEQSGANARTEFGESGANTRAQMNETGANTRASQQLGFDADKFQQVAALDSRKLDMEQENSSVANYSAKKLNSLYDKYDAAKTDEAKSEIAKQIQSLSGGKSSKPIVITQTGQTAIEGDMGGTTDNPAIIYNPDDGTFINLPVAERTFNDPQMLALQARDDISMKEKERLANLYMDGGDI